MKIFDKESCKEYWAAKASDVLLDRKIVKVKYMSDKEIVNIFGNHVYKAVICIKLDNGVWIYPSSDDEGNDVGALFTTSSELECVPTI